MMPRPLGTPDVPGGPNAPVPAVVPIVETRLHTPPLCNGAVSSWFITVMWGPNPVFSKYVKALLTRSFLHNIFEISITIKIE